MIYEMIGAVWLTDAERRESPCDLTVNWCWPNLANTWISLLFDWSNTWISGLLALNAPRTAARAPWPGGRRRVRTCARGAEPRSADCGACGAAGGRCFPACLHGHSTPKIYMITRSPKPKQAHGAAGPQIAEESSRQQGAANAGRHRAAGCRPSVSPAQPLGQHLNLSDCANTQPVKVSVTAGLGYC
jgi:hypothetical protein